VETYHHWHNNHRKQNCEEACCQISTYTGRYRERHRHTIGSGSSEQDSLLSMLAMQEAMSIENLPLEDMACYFVGV
jgi:hypothetical protein